MIEALLEMAKRCGYCGVKSTTRIIAVTRDRRPNSRRRVTPGYLPHIVELAQILQICMQHPYPAEMHSLVITHSMCKGLPPPH